MLVKIKRQDNRIAPPFWQTFEYPDRDQGIVSVSSILEYFNLKGLDSEGNAINPIAWECSCLGKQCGACVMVINRVPGLACDTFIDPKETQELIIEPLSKFPVIRDLMVDRRVIAEHQIEAGLYRKTDVKVNIEEYKYQYMAAKCLKCGLCLEVCPNYSMEGLHHYGAVMAHETYLIASTCPDQRTELKETFEKHFGRSCSGCMTCRNICPVSISTLASNGYMMKLGKQKKGKK